MTRRSPKENGWNRWRRLPEWPVPRTLDDIDDPGMREDCAIRTAEAKVLFADFELLQLDFPELRSFGRPSSQRARKGIEEWLLLHAGLVSTTQAEQCVVNTPIETTGSEVVVHRPTRYGRAFLAPVSPEASGLRNGGLLDVKGVGVAPGLSPTVALHESGLMQLGEALQDTARQWITDAVLGHSGSGFTTLPLYAVLDPGFGVSTVDGRTLPTGVQVRRAHRRPRLGIELPFPGSAEERIKLEIEMILRHYGVTSCNNGTLLRIGREDHRDIVQHGEYEAVALDDFPPVQRDLLCRLSGYKPGPGARTLRFDGVNVQLVRDVESNPSRATVVDFGNFSFVDSFRYPVLNLVAGRFMRWGGVIKPDHPAFVQPHPQLCVPGQAWFGAVAWDLAAAYSRGEMTGEDLRRKILEFITLATDRWPVGDENKRRSAGLAIQENET